MDDDDDGVKRLTKEYSTPDEIRPPPPPPKKRRRIPKKKRKEIEGGQPRFIFYHVGFGFSVFDTLNTKDVDETLVLFFDTNTKKTALECWCVFVGHATDFYGGDHPNNDASCSDDDDDDDSDDDDDFWWGE